MKNGNIDAACWVSLEVYDFCGCLKIRTTEKSTNGVKGATEAATL